MILYIKQMIILANLTNLHKTSATQMVYNEFYNHLEPHLEKHNNQKRAEAIWNNTRTHIEPLGTTVHFEPEQWDVTNMTQSWCQKPPKTVKPCKTYIVQQWNVRLLIMTYVSCNVGIT